MEVAKLVGVNIKQVFMLSMGISALLAGFAAVLFAPIHYVSPTSWTILFSSFPVIVFFGSALKFWSVIEHKVHLCGG